MIKTKAAQLTTPIESVPIGQSPMPGLIINNNDNDNDASSHGSNLITNVNNQSIANIFCFGAFADKNTGIIYNYCRGKFPFISLNGNVCFL
jgi:hypothetical protein